MLGIEEIKKILPHRYPFLMVDRIVELSDTKARGIKNVTMNEFFFQGHYPDHPVMPGVLIVEAMAQVGAIVIMKPGSGIIPYLASIDKMKFRKPVYPGDQLRMETELLGVKANMGRMKVVSYVGDELVVEGEMMFALIKEKE
jgi:beta-hydroxyacyl-ACP dehydratase FabZ